MDEWELSKENIKPLVTGRQMNSLQAALTPRQDDILLKQNQYEKRLRIYSGDDEMEVWHEYIVWAEQNFPQGGKCGNFDKLIYQCVQRFINETRYYNDDRFIQVILKFIKQNPSADKLEFFNNLENRGIGLMSGRFYCEWAWQLEQLGNSKKAMLILIKAINQGAEPKDTLLSFQKNILYRQASKINSTDVVEPSGFFPVVENREVLCSLKPLGKKNKAPIDRVANKIDPSLVSAGHQHQKQTSNLKPAQFQIYNGESSQQLRPVSTQLKFNQIDEPTKENEQKPGKWSNVKAVQKDKKIVPIGKSMSKHPGFSIHTDEDKDVGSSSTKKISGTCGVLGSKSAGTTVSTPFDPPPRNTIPMYNQALVYGGAKEMSFEEIRSATWIAKQNQYEMARRTAEEQCKRVVEKLLEERNALKQQLLMANSNSSPSSSSKSTPESLKKFQIKEETLSSQNSSIFKDSSQSSQIGNKKPSPNKSVTREVFNLWNATIGVESKNSTLEDSSKNQGTLGQIEAINNGLKKSNAKANFQIYEHNHLSEPSTDQTKNDQKATFSVFTDQVICTKENQQQKGFQVFCDEDQDDFKENKPPEGFQVYCDEDIDHSKDNKDPLHAERNHSTKSRQPTGILVESKAIHFVPLEDQDMDSDDVGEESSEEEELARPLDPSSIEHSTINKPGSNVLSKMTSTPFSFSHQPREFPIEDGFTIALDSGKIMCDSNDHGQPEFIPPQTKVSKKIALNVVKSNRISVGCLSPIMEGSREASKSSGSSGYTTSQTTNSSNFTNFTMKSLSKSCHSKQSNIMEGTNAIITRDQTGVKCDTEYPAKSRLSGNDVLSTVAYQKCLRLIAPLDNLSGYSSYDELLPKITSSSLVKFGTNCFQVISCAGKGGFASVYKARDQNDDKIVALKINTKPNEWEFYITSELQKRLGTLQRPIDVTGSVLNYHKGFFYKNGSVLISEFSFMGSLLDFVNEIKLKGVPLVESVVFYFTWELMQILEQVHSANIIHADFKPDNILLMNPPEPSCLSFKSVSCLRLIDFGQAIDLNMYKEGTTFDKVVNTNSFQCPEMIEKKPWTFQPDLYGLLASVYIMLFAQYMEVVKNPRTNMWEIKNKIKRYWKQDFWNRLFQSLLNIQSCEKIPSLKPFMAEIEEYLTHPTYIKQLCCFSNRQRTEKRKF